ncbi:hypothetical protein [Acinetobacter lwoffii]|uniref:hypothetical protein n=1 Tax=Acinetobacter lwoffii TaxID=28090 RepID=UPI003F912FDB
MKKRLSKGILNGNIMKKILTVCLSLMIVSSFSTAAELSPPKPKLDVKETVNYLIYASQQNPNLVYLNYDKFMDGNTPKVIAYYIFKKPDFVKVNQKYPDAYDYYVMSVKNNSEATRFQYEQVQLNCSKQDSAIIHHEEYDANGVLQYEHTGEYKRNRQVFSNLDDEFCKSI